MGFLIRLAITAVALWVTTLIVPGVEVHGRSGGNTVLTLIVVALIFGVVNAILKPVIQLVGCVFYLLTLGLFALVVNALLFLLTDWIASGLDLPFQVDGFWAGVLGRHRDGHGDLGDQRGRAGQAGRAVSDGLGTPGRLFRRTLTYGILPDGGQRGPAHPWTNSGQHGRER